MAVKAFRAEKSMPALSIVLDPVGRKQLAHITRVTRVYNPGLITPPYKLAVRSMKMGVARATR